jgi:erythromycin esterase-like protein
MPPTLTNAAEIVRGAAYPLTGSERDYDPLLERIGNARFVLLGGASHGTHEFYRERAVITERLIREQGFAAVAVEADWPDAYEVNRYVHGAGKASAPERALAGFLRFPSWMWRNTQVLDFIRWLRAHNDERAHGAVRAGFYGLDLYSLYGAMHAVVGYLEKVDPEAARRAGAIYSCFAALAQSTDAHGYQGGFGLSPADEQGVVSQLVELQSRAAGLPQRGGDMPEDERFFAEQNALLIRDAAQYYRGMFESRVAAWNLRERHMAETLDRLAEHLDRHVGRSRVVVWAHNSHVGDARATEMGRQGQKSLGQLMRECYGGESVHIGFTTYRGSVTAATDWDEPPAHMRLPEAPSGSYEALLHDAGLPQYLLVLTPGQEHSELLRQPRQERAIGVIYRAQTEGAGPCFEARLSGQFDAVIHLDETRAVEPLEILAPLTHGEPPETYPSSL